MPDALAVASSGCVLAKPVLALDSQDSASLLSDRTAAVARSFDVYLVVQVLAANLQARLR